MLHTLNVGELKFVYRIHRFPYPGMNVLKIIPKILLAILILELICSENFRDVSK